MPDTIWRRFREVWTTTGAWLSRPKVSEKLPFVEMLLLISGTCLLVVGPVPALSTAVIGAFVLWQDPERAERIGAAFAKWLAGSLATERSRFVWVIVFWSIALFFIGSWITTLIALLALLAYWNFFIDFLKAAFKNEWPYNFLGTLGAGILYVFSVLASVFSDFVISTITGFHPAQFPSVSTLLSALFMFFAFFFTFTIISGLAGLVTGFSSKIASRIFPIAFMLSIPGLVTLVKWISQDQVIIDLTEEIIIATSFNHNARFEYGWYAAKEGTRSYGTKVCRGLPFETLLTPHSEGGYITATPRAHPAALVAPAFPTKREIMATKYVYGFVEQKECPAIHEYIDELETPRPSETPASHQ